MVAESTLPLGNGHTTTYSYDSRYRLSGIVTTNGTITPQDVGYSYDEAGNIIETNDHASSEDLWYKYDALNRLTEMRLGSASGPLQAAYTYDPAPSLGGRLGNMTAKQEGAAATPAAMTYNAEHVHAPSTYNSGPLLYDKNGNLTASMWVETFLYNVENQRAQATNWWYNLVTNYLYDGDGNLVRRDSTLPGFAPSIRTDVEELYQEDSVGCATTPTTTTRFYRAFGRIIATRNTTSSTSDVRYYVADHLGSTNTILTASGGVYVGGTKYWPFGAQRTGSTPDHGYTGQLRDDYSTIGAYYYHARFYSTTLAHFMSADSFNSDGLNRYGYGRANPIAYSDPSGHCVGGLYCDPAVVMNTLACALGNVACQMVFNSAAPGVIPAGASVSDAVLWASFAVHQGQFWANALQPDNNPFRSQNTLAALPYYASPNAFNYRVVQSLARQEFLQFTNVDPYLLNNFYDVLLPLAQRADRAYESYCQTADCVALAVHSTHLGLIIGGLLFGDFGAVLEGAGPYLRTDSVFNSYVQYQYDRAAGRPASLDATADVLNVAATTFGPDEVELIDIIVGVYRANHPDQFSGSKAQ